MDFFFSLPCNNSYLFISCSTSIMMVGFFSGLAVSLTILFGVIVPSTSQSVALLLKGRIKFVVLGLCALTLLFVLLSWALFLRFPKALNRSIFCTQNPGYYWCDSFIGSKEQDGITVYWGPHFGWIFACIAMGVMILVALVAALLRRVRVVRPTDYERAPGQ